jgi:hypothetical protein
MKRRIVFLAMMLIALISLTGCPPAYMHDHRGDVTELHIIASSSLLRIPGRSWDIISVLEQDDFGRVMFVFVADGPNVFSVLISQRTTETHSYFYSSYNFILADWSVLDIDFHETRLLFDEEISDIAHKLFSQDHFDALKEANDWNREINEDRLFRVEIVRVKDNNVVSSRRQQGVFEEIFRGVSVEFRPPRSILMATDSNGNSIYTMVAPTFYTDEYGTPGVRDLAESYIVMFNSRSRLVASEQLLDQWNYQEQLRNFKRSNGWAFYIN